MTTYHDNKAIKEVGSLKARSIIHCETNQCRGFLTQASKFYENPSYVSCFLVGTLPCVYHSKKNSWSPFTYWNQWWTRIWNEGHFGFMGLYLSILIFCSLAWVWCERAYLGTNQEPIKCYGEGAWVLLTISKQAQVCSLWNSLLEGEVMSQMSMPWGSLLWMFIHDLYWTYT
jgi:hypothetical protein